MKYYMYYTKIMWEVDKIKVDSQFAYYYEQTKVIFQ